MPNYDIRPQIYLVFSADNMQNIVNILPANNQHVSVSLETLLILNIYLKALLCLSTAS